MAMLEASMAHQLREAYEQDGYLIIRGLLDRDQLAELRDAVNTPLVQEQRQANRRKGYDGLSIIHDIIYLDPAFLKLARNTKLLDAVEALVGANIEIQHCKINWKPPEIGAGEVKWHQDFPYLPHTNYDLCAAFIVLDDTTVENGCMRVIPKSHKFGQLKHTDENGNLLLHVNDDRFIESRYEASDLILGPGDASIHHVLTVHGSYPNRSIHPRCAIIYEFRAADAMQIGGGLKKTTGILVRGSPSSTVRCDAGNVFVGSR
jgi:ectoine hydroxylase-related dioxygenase (phytanoyl-CoA dioxygenase family)